VGDRDTIIVGITIRAISLTIASTNLMLFSSRSADSGFILAVSFAFARVVPITELSIFAVFVFFTGGNAFSLVSNSDTNVGSITSISVGESITSTNGIPGGNTKELIPRFTDSWTFACLLETHQTFTVKVRVARNGWPSNRDWFIDGHDLVDRLDCQHRLKGWLNNLFFHRLGCQN